jgi:receptor protein-tyrosine kinase
MPEAPRATDSRRPAAADVAQPSVSRSAGGEQSRAVALDFRALRQSGMVTPDNMASVISNEFRGIKRKLLQKARDPDTRAVVNNLVMVTSSLPGEGKTFTSLNLAISLAAERGLQVLLIDADVVRPAVGNMFKSTPREGLTDLLSGKSQRVSDVMCRCAEVPNLAVIFSGHARVDSPELISSGRMVDLCKELSSRYRDRIIIIDTPPVLASPEPATLAAYVHQLIMVVAADQTDRHQLRKSLESVAACANISLLFNKAPRWNESEYRSYYGYAASNAASASALPS